jgi:hypothetical protein
VPPDQTDSFNVVLDGTILAGYDPTIVKAQLAALIKRDVQFAGRLLSGHTTKIKSEVDAATGARYMETLQRIGVAVHLEPETLEVDADLLPTAAIANQSQTPNAAREDPAAMRESPVAPQNDQLEKVALPTTLLESEGVLRYGKIGIPRRIRASLFVDHLEIIAHNGTAILNCPLVKITKAGASGMAGLIHFVVDGQYYSLQFKSITKIAARGLVAPAFGLLGVAIGVLTDPSRDVVKTWKKTLQENGVSFL